LPKPAGGDTVIDLDWLARTDPNNLYPFVVVLPSQNLFIGTLTSLTRSYIFHSHLLIAAYYNEARILEPATFTTIKTLPNIPGAVNDCKVNFATVCTFLNASHSHCWSHISFGRLRYASSTTLSLYG
jgi:hypothetical protein